MPRINITVLMGGKSPEYEISLISGRQVVNNLNKKKYKILPVIISRNGKEWKRLGVRELLSLPNPLLLRGTNKDIVISKTKDIQLLGPGGRNKIEVIFIAMHGPFGEDGTVQGILELAGLRYTGSKVLASAIGMDKIMFRKLMASEEISIPRYIVVNNGDSLSNISKVLGSPPYFVKPHNQGSSVGASIVKEKKDLGKALKTAFHYSDTALVDEYIKGKEITCGIIGNEKPIPLPVIEIIPKKGEFFDYESKYSESGAEEIVPARISKSLTKKVQELAIKVYKLVGARGFARIDFILRDNRYPYVLEINTIPGLTPMSLLPKAAKVATISYPELLDKIIKYALE